MRVRVSLWLKFGISKAGNPIDSMKEVISKQVSTYSMKGE